MSRYTEAHANPAGPGDARPTAMQIIEDEEAGGKLEGQVIVITGISSGIGVETARALAATGATLFFTARDLSKAQKAVDGFFDPSRMELIKMDQESLSSVREAAATILTRTSKIHLLVNNAGIMAIPELRLTADGYELQFGTNHLSHFLFYKLLETALLAAATPELPSRVVSLSSSAHNAQGLNEPDNYNFEKGNYNPWAAYGQSKTANIYLANEIERRFGSRNLHANSVHPGFIMTGLGKHLPPEVWKGYDHLYPQFKTVEQGAATSVWAAIGKEWENKGGRYLLDCQEAKPFVEVKGSLRMNSLGHAPWAYDVEEAKRLWRDSLRMVGLDDED